MTVHVPLVDHRPRTATDPAETTVECTCGHWRFESIESIAGGLEAWGDAWDEHLIDMEATQ